jgi:hypothetical protein
MTSKYRWPHHRRRRGVGISPATRMCSCSACAHRLSSLWSPADLNAHPPIKERLCDAPTRALCTVVTLNLRLQICANPQKYDKTSHHLALIRSTDAVFLFFDPSIASCIRDPAFKVWVTTVSVHTCTRIRRSSRAVTKLRPCLHVLPPSTSITHLLPVGKLRDARPAVSYTQLSHGLELSQPPRAPLCKRC